MGCDLEIWKLSFPKLQISILLGRVGGGGTLHVFIPIVGPHCQQILNILETMKGVFKRLQNVLSLSVLT